MLSPDTVFAKTVTLFAKSFVVNITFIAPAGIVKLYVQFCFVIDSLFTLTLHIFLLLSGVSITKLPALYSIFHPFCLIHYYAYNIITVFNHSFYNAFLILKYINNRIIVTFCAIIYYPFLKFFQFSLFAQKAIFI